MQNKSMSQYLSKIKTKVDLIVASGSPISSKNVIYYTLQGLPPTYQGFKAAIRTNLQLLHQDDFYSLLYSEETYQTTEAAHLEGFAPTTLATTCYYGRSRTNNNSVSRGQSSAHRGRGRQSTIDCQIYGKPGHSAFHCWHRSNLDFMLKSRPIEANLATPVTQDWLLDTGASTHVSNDPSKLQNLTPYKGTQQITLGNGQQTKIVNEG